MADNCKFVSSIFNIFSCFWSPYWLIFSDQFKSAIIVFIVSNNIYLGISHIFLIHIFADIELIIKLRVLAAILNLKYVTILKVPEVGLLDPITYFVRQLFTDLAIFVLKCRPFCFESYLDPFWGSDFGKLLICSSPNLMLQKNTIKCFLAFF